MSGDVNELEGIRKLYEFSRSLLTDQVSENILERLVEATRAIIDADEVVLFEASQGGLEILARTTDPVHLSDPPTKVVYSKTLVQEVVHTAEPLLLRDVYEDPRFEHAASVTFLAITSAVGAPLWHRGELKGVLYAARRRMAENFSTQDRDLMTVVASQASLLLSRLASMEARRETESRYRALVEMSPSSILLVRAGEVIFANATACELWERDDVEDLIGRTTEELFEPWRSQTLMQALDECRRFESLGGWVGGLKDESLIKAVEVTGRPVVVGRNEAMQLIVTEVGEKHALLSERAQMDRLATMGTMAATVGHEINNPLSYVYANLDFVVEELPQSWSGEGDRGEKHKEIMKGLRAALEGTERIRGVVKSIQDFTRLDDESGEPTLVSGPLKSSLRIAGCKLASNVELQVDLRPTSPVAVSAARLGQVFLNLLVNAAQALDEVDREQPRRIEVRSREIDEQVIVEIADNGPGIAAEAQRHIFEPFVSTREEQGGTGLGLSICREIVDAAGGSLEVESQVGQGSLFRVRLPAVDEPATESLDFLTEGNVDRRGRIFVVDPEMALGQSVQRILQSDHDVTLACSMRDAVEQLGDPRRFDLILCDLRMHGGPGHDLFAWIEANAPAYWCRLVAMTAEPIAPRARRRLEALPNPWLGKPFTNQRLRAVVANLLEAFDELAEEEAERSG